LSEFKTIKVRKETYDELKRLGVGISKAVEILVEEQKHRIQRKIDDIRAVGKDIANILLEHGVFDIRFKGAEITDVQVDGDTIYITARAGVSIPNEEARMKILEVIGVGGESGEEGKGA